MRGETGEDIGLRKADNIRNAIQHLRGREKEREGEGVRERK